MATGDSKFIKVFGNGHFQGWLRLVLALGALLIATLTLGRSFMKDIEHKLELIQQAGQINATANATQDVQIATQGVWIESLDKRVCRLEEN